jgi:hypothetical protein
VRAGHTSGAASCLDEKNNYRHSPEDPMSSYLVTANVNVTTDAVGRSIGLIDGYQDGHQVATVGYFDITADTVQQAADRMYDIGNGYATDDKNQGWPYDVRSLCVGDVLYLAEGDEQVTESVTILAVIGAGFRPVPQPANHCQVALAGSIATSRVA